MIEMAKIIKKEVLICSDCMAEVYTCDGCENHFADTQEIICQEDDAIQKHFCNGCE